MISSPPKNINLKTLKPQKIKKEGIRKGHWEGEPIFILSPLALMSLLSLLNLIGLIELT
jgi:hypothetical protein